jgi:hypothetical protein
MSKMAAENMKRILSQRIAASEKKKGPEGPFWSKQNGRQRCRQARQSRTSARFSPSAASVPAAPESR